MADTFTGVGVGGISSALEQAAASAAISASESISVINRVFFTNIMPNDKLVYIAIQMLFSDFVISAFMRPL